MLQPITILNRHEEKITIGEYDYIKEKIILFYGHNKDYFGNTITVRMPLDDKVLSPDYPVALIDRDFDRKYEMSVEKYKELFDKLKNSQDRTVRISTKDLVRIR